jgi:glycosyltransferase involved in cell wall biosynthesis
MKKISIITPCYNENENINFCYNSIKVLFKTELNNYEYEHIFCDNNSRDGTQEKLRTIASKDKNIKIIFNSRNFGSQKSNLNGIKNSSGDAVVLYFPADVQDPAEIIIQFVKYWEKGFELVYGSRKKRRENFALTFCRKLFYIILNIGSKNLIPSDISDYQLVDKKIVDEIKKNNDTDPLLRSLPFSITDNYKKIDYNMNPRKAGKTKFSFFSLFDYALSGLLNVSYTPFRIILYFGITISLFSIFFVAYFMFEFYFFRPDIGRGIPLLITFLFFFSGIQIFLIGMIGEYLVAIHKQVKNKENLVEKEKINF